MGLQLFPAGTSLAELENQITGKLNQWEKESGGEKKKVWLQQRWFGAFRHKFSGKCGLAGE